MRRQSMTELAVARQNPSHSSPVIPPSQNSPSIAHIIAETIAENSLLLKGLGTEHQVTAHEGTQSGKERSYAEERLGFPATDWVLPPIYGFLSPRRAVWTALLFPCLSTLVLDLTTDY